MWQELRLDLELAWLKWRGVRNAPLRNLIQELDKVLNEEPVNPAISSEDRQLVDRILQETSAKNRNNITRTEAYLKFYLAHPEIHWSLLAHAVSRNGGYGMSDVRGEWFSRLADTHQADAFFGFLERSNWLIFHDAFPQLLLYRESCVRGKSLFYLLPAFSVSRFMQPIWEYFWVTKDASLLSNALILNEQHYIEDRVVQNPLHRQAVFSTFVFQAQSWLDLTTVLLPYQQQGRIQLAGTTVQDFGSVLNRIQTGQKLYRCLFHTKLQTPLRTWFCGHPHTGSRADYLPHYFSPHRDFKQTGPYKPRFTLEGSAKMRVYSPQMAEVWPDVQHAPAESGDWFRNMRVVAHLFHKPDAAKMDFMPAYVDRCRFIERLIMAKESLFSDGK